MEINRPCRNCGETYDWFSYPSDKCDNISECPHCGNTDLNIIEEQ